MTVQIPVSTPWKVSSHSLDVFTESWFLWPNSTSATLAWPSQYQAVYVPVAVRSRVVAKKMWFGSGSTGTGNLDIGIYDAAGTRLVSTGSTAKDTTNGVRWLDITDTTLLPGLYYLALNSDSTTDTYKWTNSNAAAVTAAGLLFEAVGSVTLPATASWGTDSTRNYFPRIGAMLVTELS